MANVIEIEPKAELARRPEWVASYQGYSVYIDPDLSPGTVKILNHYGHVIGIICDVGKIHIADKSVP